MQTSILFSYAGYYAKNLPIPIHSHRGVELVYVSKGECETVFAGGISLPAKAGTVYVSPPEIAHVQKNLTEDCETYYSVMEISGNEWNTSLRTIDASGDRLLAQWFRNLYELNSSYAQDEASLLLTVIWNRLSSIEKSKRLRQNFHPALIRAMDYLEEHYAEILAISELAEKAGISQSHLNALFRQETGLSAVAFITRCRLNAARQMLETSGISIQEVMEHCGFRDQSRFGKLFREFTGYTPLVYHKKFRRKKDV